MYEYPFGNGQQLNLDWFIAEWKNLLAAWEAEKNGIKGALQAEIDRAEAALADVFAARDATAQSAANALESKNAAAQSASDASGYLTTVRADANTASNAAQNAAQSESNAAESAQTALASKNTAANSERNAAQSEANANSSKNAAAQSAADAQEAEQNVQNTIESATEAAIATATQSANDAANRAGQSASAAAQSAADADASKSAAAQSAEDAEDAAASVEASAQQIATNTSNINHFLKSIPNVVVPLECMSVGNFSGYGANCIVKANRNIIEIENMRSSITPNVITNGNPPNTNAFNENEAIYLPKGLYKFTARILENTLTVNTAKFSLRMYDADGLAVINNDIEINDANKKVFTTTFTKPRDSVSNFIIGFIDNTQYTMAGNIKIIYELSYIPEIATASALTLSN